MKSKVVSLLLVCVLALSTVVGCAANNGNQNNQNTTTDSSSTKTETPAATTETKTETPAATETTTEAEPEPAAETSSLPPYSEITVEIFNRGNVGGTDPTDNYYTDWIKQKVLEELNIGVNFIAVSRWEETSQLPVLMASRVAPDICFTYSMDLVNNFGLQGGLVDMTPYVDELLPDLKAFLGPDLALEGRDMIYRNQNQETKATYAIPARRIVVAQNNTFIRKDWLDKLGLGIPQTTDEFYNALKAFKEQDPGNVGKDKVVPFTVTKDVRWRASNLLESFIDPNLSRQDRWVNTVADRTFLLPGYKDGVRFLNKMFSEGLIDKEFMLYTDDTGSDNLIKSGVVGAFIHNWDQAYRDTPGYLNELLPNVPDAELVAIDPFVNAAGQTAKGLYDAAGLNYFIPIFSKNVEGALKYMNWMSKYENFHYLQIGDEGVTHDIVNGLPKMKTAEGEKIMNSGNNIDYTFVLNGVYEADPVKQAQVLANSYSVDPKYIVEAYDLAMKDGRPAIVVPVVIESAGPVNETLVQKGETLMSQALTCKPADFDKVWDANIQDWLASGAQEVINERAAKYIEP